MGFETPRSSRGSRVLAVVVACALVGAVLSGPTPAGAGPRAAGVTPRQVSPGPSEVVTAAYQGLLGRSPDPGGLSHWLGAMQRGLSPRHVVTEVARSPEHARFVVATAYRTFLGRDPDPGGLEWWAGHLTRTRSLTSLRAELVGSAEYLATRAGGSLAGFVDQLYHDVLGRAPDATGRAYWLALLEDGTSRRQIARSVLVSSEAYRLSDLPVLSTAPRPGTVSWSLDLQVEVDAELVAEASTMIVSVGGRQLSGWLTVGGGTIGFEPLEDHPAWVPFGSTSEVVVTVLGFHDGRVDRFDYGFTYRAPVAVSSFSTPLVPGQSRNVNIARAAELLDGQVIRSGERLSLNAAIGERTVERGFVPNGFISGGELVSAVGGGVSQVATTFLSAAWFAGIGLETFRPHTIYFPRYPMCREATIVWDSVDLVVVNDTLADLTIVTSVRVDELTIQLFGVPWASVDSWIGEPEGELIGGPFRVECGRTITYPDGTTADERYSWFYQAGFPGPER